MVGDRLSLGEGLTKGLIVVLLFVLMLFLQAVHQPHEGLLNPVSMATFGFIILAAFTLGEILETVKLPHITAYLVTGILCGHHAHEVLHTPDWMVVLDEHTIRDLSLFDNLAVALIALSAGGDLGLPALKRGAKLLSGILGFQFLLLLSVLGGLVWLLSGPIDGFAVPFLVEQPTEVKVAAAVLLAVIGSAMSPAASIAIVHETNAKGPVTDTVLGVSVLNNVVVVVLFAVAMSVVGTSLGAEPSEQGLAVELLLKIGGSVLLGGALGVGVTACIRWVGQEFLLILAGLCFGVTWLAGLIGVDPLLSFLFAGFVVRNFTRAHGTLKAAVDRLSLPIYVVFFFLAGAHLDLRGLGESAAFAALLFAARLASLYAGTAAGSILARGPRIFSRWGFLGFGAQAGIALAMATAISQLGDTGASLATMAVAGIAINEMFGPVLLKVTLGLAGETQREDDPTLSEDYSLAEDATAEIDRPLPEWLPEPGHTHFDPWGEPPLVSWRRLLELSRELKAELQHLTRELRSSTTARRRRSAQDFLSQLRREMLRYHRRLTAKASDPNTTPEDMAQAVRESRRRLATSWENHILDRAATVDFRHEHEVLLELVRAIDKAVDALPQATEVPYEDGFLRPLEGDSRLVRASKLLARGVRGLGLGHDLRVVEIRPLARYTLSGHAPQHLGELAGLMALSERHLLARTRNVFELLRRSEDNLLEHEDFVAEKWESLLALLLEEIEEEFQIAQREVDRLADETVRVAAAAVGRPYKQFNRFLGTAGTPSLTTRDYRFSKVYSARKEALEELGTGLAHSRDLTRAIANGMAMELQLLCLRDLAEDAVDQHGHQLERELHGRVVVQLGRIVTGLDSGIETLVGVLEEELGPDPMLSRIEACCEPTLHVIEDALSIAEAMRDSLRSESVVEPLRDALADGVDHLTDHFQVALNPPGLTGRRLPAPPRLEDIPFRELATGYLDAEVGRDLSLILEQLLKEVEVIVRATEELQRSLSFNVELAHTELGVVAAQGDRVPAGAREVLRETLLATMERFAARLGQLHTQHENLGRLSHERIRAAVFDQIEGFHDLLVGGRWDEVRRRLARGQIERRRRIITGGAESFGELGSYLDDALRRTMGTEAYEDARRRLGLPEAPPETIGPDDFTAPVSPVELPVVFRRLFSDATLEAADLLEGREQELGRIRRVLSGHETGASRSVSILGAGQDTRGAAVNFVLRGLDVKVVRHTLTGYVEDPDEIEQIAAKATGGVVVVVEGAHWLFTIEPGGFAPLRAFARLVVEDQGLNAFLLSIEKTVWAYADRVVSLSEVFPHTLRLRPLSPHALRSSILQRHVMSGYGLRFAAPESSLGWSLKEAFARGRGRGRDELYEEAYFEHLHEATGGVLSDALALWMASATEVDSRNDLIVIGDVPDTPLSALRSLSDETLLTLRQLARQGRIDVHLHARQFRKDEDRSRAELAMLGHLGLVERTRKGRYVLADHLVAALHRVLVERGFQG